MANVNGTAGNDVIHMANVNGTAGNDVIHVAGDGSVVPAGFIDIPLATNGADTIDANAGNDTVAAGAGNDTVDGDSGNDVLGGGEMPDPIHRAFEPRVAPNGRDGRNASARRGSTPNCHSCEFSAITGEMAGMRS